MATSSSAFTGPSNIGHVTSEVSALDSKTFEEFRHSWKIKFFDVIRWSNDDVISDQHMEFKMGSNIGLPIKLTFHLCPEPGNWIGCYFRLIEAPKLCKEINVSFTIKIKKPNGDTFFFRETDGPQNMIYNKSWDHAYTTEAGFSKLASRTVNVNDELPLVNGTLTIDFEFKLFASEKPESMIEDEMKHFEMLFFRQLSDDFDRLPSTTDIDTKIISGDGVEFIVNRRILSVRSAVFRTMFQTKMTESETVIIRLDDLSSKVITVLLKYINAAKLHKDWKDDDVIEDLIYAAHKYELHLLLQCLEKDKYRDNYRPR